MDIKEQRMISLFNTTNYFAFGTLWKIKNYLWQKVIPDFVSKKDTGHHPALSLGKKNITSLCQTIPMLLGSHSNKIGFPIHNFSETEKGAAGFFKIRPFLFCVADAVGPQKGIERNEHKPRLDAKEISELKTYLLKKGVRFDD